MESPTNTTGSTESGDQHFDGHAPDGLAQQPEKRGRGRPPKGPLSTGEVEAQFVEDMSANGRTPADPSRIRADGNAHRYTVEDDDRGSDNGFYRLTMGDRPWGFYVCNKRDSDNSRVHYWAPEGAKKLSKVERQKINREVQREREQRAQEDRAKRAKAQVIATDTWNAGKPATKDNEYLIAKGDLEPCGARICEWPGWPGGVLTIRLMCFNGAVHSLQKIYRAKDEYGNLAVKADGVTPRFDKILLKDGAKQGHFFPMGAKRPKQVDGREVYLIAEGFSTSCSLHMCSDHAVLCAIDGGNLKAVAIGLRAYKPKSIIIICGDNDQYSDKNKGLECAEDAARACGGWAVVPDFVSLDGKPTDANDLHAREGADKVRELINGVIAKIQKSERDGTAPKLPRRLIQYTEANLPAVTDEAERALREQCTFLYQRAGFIVKPQMVAAKSACGDPTEVMRVTRIGLAHLVECMTLSAEWQKWIKTSDSWEACGAPEKVADTYMARTEWKLPELTGTVNAPTLRFDGTILSRPGYDEATGILFEPGAFEFPPLPTHPTKDEARAAIGRLKEILSGYVFESINDLAVALSGILTTMIRRSLPTAPLHGFNASTAGSGKTKLADVASIIATGQKAPVMAQGGDDTETEKRLVSAMLKGDPIIVLDNCTRPVDGDLLCQMLTSEKVDSRILGRSEAPTMLSNAMMFATGNGLTPQGDITRRSVLATINPGVERPELREFDFEPCAMALAGRAGYVRDALIVLRAYHVAGRPPHGKPILGSFEAWDGWVRAALIWLGEGDPVATQDVIRDGDPKTLALQAVLHSWKVAVGMGRITAPKLIKAATECKPGDGCWELKHPELNDALMAVAGIGGKINSRALGRWLAANQKRLVDGMRIVRAGVSEGVLTWSLEKATDKTAAPATAVSGDAYPHIKSEEEIC